MSRKVFQVLFSAALFFLLNSSIQQKFLQAKDAEPNTDPAVETSIKSRHIFKSDVDASLGHIEVNEAQFDFTKDFKIHELPLTFGVTVKETDINENLSANLPSRLVGEEFLLGAKFPTPFLDSEHYFIGLDVFPSMYTDDGDFKSSAFRIPFRTYLIYKQSDDFILVIGVNIRPQYDTVVVPVIGMTYKPNDRLSFNLATSDPNITYKINDKLTALLEFNDTIDEYEVTRNGQNGVVFKFNESSVGGGFKYEFTKNIEALITAGGVFGRYMEYRDKVDKTIPNAGVYTNFKLNAKF